MCACASCCARAHVHCVHVWRTRPGSGRRSPRPGRWSPAPTAPWPAQPHGDARVRLVIVPPDAGETSTKCRLRRDHLTVAARLMPREDRSAQRARCWLSLCSGLAARRGAGCCGGATCRGHGRVLAVRAQHGVRDTITNLEASLFCRVGGGGESGKSPSPRAHHQGTAL